MSKKPAARLGDTALDCADPVDTPTGTVVAKGTVFINKMPAAKQNDQIMGTDIHIIMIPSPAGPVPTPLPHPFAGIINLDTVPTVKIMGMPAAVVGSIATNMPPHIPQGGAFQMPPKNQAKIITGSPDVFIGTGSGGGGGGGGGSVSGGSDGIFNHAVATSDVDAAEYDGHYLDGTFRDSADTLVTGTGYRLTDTDDRISGGVLPGGVRRYRVSEGEAAVALFNITGLEWSVSSPLTAGTSVGLRIDTVGIADGTPVRFEVWERETDAIDKMMARIDPVPIAGGKAETTWTYPVEKRSDDGPISPSAVGADKYAVPSYYFTASVKGLEKRSPILAYHDDVVFEIACPHGYPIGHLEYTAFLSSGEVRKGRLDADGRGKIEGTTSKNVKVTVKGVTEKLAACRDGRCSGGSAASSSDTGSATASDELWVYDLAWSKKTAEWNEPVTLRATVENAQEGAPATLTIYENGATGAADGVVTLSAEVKGGTISAPFVFEHDSGRYLTPTLEEIKQGATPEYYFTVTVQGHPFGINKESKLLKLMFDTPKSATVLEFEDVLFNSDSAALMPKGRPDPEKAEQNTIAGLDVLVTVFQYLFDTEFENKKLLSMGHTDSTGSNTHNLTLSETRANAIYYLLVGDKEKWVAAVESRKDIQKEKYRNEDLRRVLTWIDEVSVRYDKNGAKWDCDPGKVDGSPIDSRMREAIENFRNGYNDSGRFTGTYTKSANGPRYWGWAAQGDDPGWGAVYDIYDAEIARELDPYKLEEARQKAKTAFTWSTGSDTPDQPYPVIGCGEERPLDRCAADDTAAGRACQTNRRVEIVFFDPAEADEITLPCHDDNRHQTICNTDDCPLWGKENGIQKVEMVYLSKKPSLVSPIFYCPEAPGAKTEIPINNLYLWVSKYDSSGKLVYLEVFKVKEGRLHHWKEETPRTLKVGAGYFFYFTNRNDLAPRNALGDFDLDLFAQLFEKGTALPLQGPVDVTPEDDNSRISRDIWAQDDWVLFRKIEVDGAVPDAVKLADWNDHYQTGELRTNRWHNYQKYDDKDDQERWRGSTPLLDFVQVSAPDDIPLLVSSMSAILTDKLKVVAECKKGDDSCYVASFNEIDPKKGNTEVLSHHTYDKTLVDRLFALGRRRQDEDEVRALPDPPARCLLSGDTCWHDQGQTTRCGTFSIAAALNYWLPYTHNPFGENGDRVAEKIHEHPLGGGYTPRMLVNGMKKHYPLFQPRDNDAERLDRDLVLKLIKLWIVAGVPLIVDVKEDKDEGGQWVHFKLLVGYDGDRVFFNNSGLDDEAQLPNQDAGIDYETAPVGNDVSSENEFYLKMRAVPDVIDAITSHDECDFIPVYPEDAQFQQSGSTGTSPMGPVSCIMEPKTFYGPGTIIARLKSEKGEDLSSVKTMTIGGREVEKVWHAPSGYLYFVPPPADADTAVTEVTFDNTDTAHPLTEKITYTNQPKQAAESIREQLSVLRDAIKDRMAQCKEESDDSTKTKMIHSEIVKNGHYRLELALNRIWKESFSNEDLDQVASILEEAIEAHAASMDSEFV